MGEFTGEPEEVREDEQVHELNGQFQWPDPDGQDNNHQQQYRRKYRDPADVGCDIDGEPLAPHDFVLNEQNGNGQIEQAMGELYKLIFDRPVDGLRPKWQRAWDLTPKRNADGTVQVERVTYAPVVWSLRDISSELQGEGICVERGVNAGKDIEPWQIQEWKLRAGVKAFVEFFFKEHRDLLDAYLERRRMEGETDISRDAILQRFVDGVAKLLRGQYTGSHKDR